ncbi:hypothetical protein GCM10020221_24330 [Streptomyces thioluteus]|uniref:Pr1-like protein n=1 Tax=Streptomyces thioluteus TaxID=66431 RepID=A0ABN3WTG7_STRTU
MEGPVTRPATSSSSAARKADGPVHELGEQPREGEGVGEDGEGAGGLAAELDGAADAVRGEEADEEGAEEAADEVDADTRRGNRRTRGGT